MISDSFKISTITEGAIASFKSILFAKNNKGAAFDLIEGLSNIISNSFFKTANLPVSAESITKIIPLKKNRKIKFFFLYINIIKISCPHIPIVRFARHIKYSKRNVIFGKCFNSISNSRGHLSEISSLDLKKKNYLRRFFPTLFGFNH